MPVVMMTVVMTMAAMFVDGRDHDRACHTARLIVIVAATAMFVIMMGMIMMGVRLFARAHRRHLSGSNGTSSPMSNT